MTSRKHARAVWARRLAVLIGSTAFIVTMAPGGAETVTYTYDAKGRLIKVDHGSTGPNAGVAANYSYDNADNRTSVTSAAGSTGITLALSPASLPNGTVGTAYSQTITASGGSAGYSYAVSSGALPTGLSLNGTTGAITGTPTAATSYSFTVKATDGVGDVGTRSYTVTVNAAVAISPATLPNGAAGTAYSQSISASGGSGGYTYSVSSGTLPAGLTLNSSSGLLSGIPSTAASYTFTAKATDSSGSIGTRAYTVTIATAGTVTIQLTSADHNLRTVANNNGYTGSSSANYTFVVGSGVTVTGSAAGGAGIDTGSWPAGVTLSLQVNGTVAGGGGNGGNGGSDTGGGASSGTPGGPGGDALQCHAVVAISISSGALVEAGGGGGGGGGVTSSNPAFIPGGGGGGGAPNGAGGAPGTGVYATATAGASGTTAGGGTGGNGEHGGNGGSYATAGMAGINGGLANGGPGGAAGYAVRKNGIGCTVTNSGTITGTVG